MSQKVHHNLWSWTCYAMFKEVKELEFFMAVILAHYAICIFLGSSLMFLMRVIFSMARFPHHAGMPQ